MLIAKFKTVCIFQGLPMLLAQKLSKILVEFQVFLSDPLIVAESPWLPLLPLKQFLPVLSVLELRLQVSEPMSERHQPCLRRQELVYSPLVSELLNNAADRGEFDTYLISDSPLVHVEREALVDDVDPLVPAKLLQSARREALGDRYFDRRIRPLVKYPVFPQGLFAELYVYSRESLVDAQWTQRYLVRQ